MDGSHSLGTQCRGAERVLFALARNDRIVGGGFLSSRRSSPHVWFGELPKEGRVPSWSAGDPQTLRAPPCTGKEGDGEGEKPVLLLVLGSLPATWCECCYSLPTVCKHAPARNSAAPKELPLAPKELPFAQRSLHAFLGRMCVSARTFAFLLGVPAS